MYLLLDVQTNLVSGVKPPTQSGVAFYCPGPNGDQPYTYEQYITSDLYRLADSHKMAGDYVANKKKFTLNWAYMHGRILRPFMVNVFETGRMFRTGSLIVRKSDVRESYRIKYDGNGAPILDAEFYTRIAADYETLWSFVGYFGAISYTGSHFKRANKNDIHKDISLAFIEQ